ncbi:DUF6090 family protein [Robiginitalea aurantiaca]|uniref:DUF6090 family protein n=1 Tax=Robiginitalea aurantiaca TaxID=3056915 RepID=A0ABT7WIB3_9FLAO|nr:DUF6090 family protein [Robiginitalea aurantiaca]MDM9632672.1 DUF6090 family protein [Robiginitalea aurantiaca]
MLRFFRQIRQRLLTDNKFSKYLLYAVGEILLVVIGILIALQIGSWNEDRKTKLSADRYRSKLINDLVNDTLNINQLMADGSLMQNEIEAYFKDFETQNLSLDECIKISGGVRAHFFRYFPINYTFEDMKNTGNAVLLSEEQRKALIELYNEQKFLLIIIDKSITDIKTYQYERGKHLDFDASESDFFDKVNWKQDTTRKKQGLLSQHNVLSNHLSLVTLFNYHALRIKDLTKKCIDLLNK